MSPGGGYGVGMTSKHEAQQQLGTDDVLYDVTLRAWLTLDEWFELEQDEVPDRLIGRGAQDDGVL